MPRAEQRQALRAYTEEPIRQGGLESPWTGRLVGGLVLGKIEFARRVLSGGKINPEEQTSARKLRPRVSWEKVKRTSERIRGSRWDEWAERYGDWGRDGAIYVAVRYRGLRLAEVVEPVEGLRYQAAAQGLKRFGESLSTDRSRRRFVMESRRATSHI